MHFVISLKNLSPYSPSWNTESLLVPWALAWISEAGDGSVGRSGWLQLFLWFETWLWGNTKSPVWRGHAARDPPCAMWIMIHGSCVEVKSWVIGSPTTRESSGGCCEFRESLAMPLGWRQELNDERVAGQDRVVSSAEAWRRLLAHLWFPVSGSDSVMPHLQLLPSLLPVLSFWWDFLSYPYARSRSCYNAWCHVGNSALANRMH